MNIKELLSEAKKQLDAGTLYDGMGIEAMCLYHLGALHGLLFQFTETEKVKEVRTCRVCGCTQENPCPPGCCWLEEDLCTACASKAQ